VQVHIAGHKKRDEIIIDTHGAPIIEAVYDLLAYVVGKSTIHGVLLERDQNFPEDFNEIVAELAKIRSITGDSAKFGISRAAVAKVRSELCC
jgi:uncharacterized protein (UPF0276 family)